MKFWNKLLHILRVLNLNVCNFRRLLNSIILLFATLYLNVHIFSYSRFLVFKEKRGSIDYIRFEEMFRIFRRGNFILEIYETILGSLFYSA